MENLTYSLVVNKI